MDEGLSIFASLVGRCFAATMTPDVTDRHCFSDMWDGSHVRDVHVVTAKGKAVYSGETIYSVADGRIEFVYLNSDGGSGRGTAKGSGGRIDFDMTMRGTSVGAAKPMQLSWTLGTDGYVVTSAGRPPLRFVAVPGTGQAQNGG